MPRKKREGRVRRWDRELPSGRRQIYLHYMIGSGKRVRENLGLMLVGDRLQDRETERIAEIKKAERERELQLSEHGLTSAFKRRSDFLDYYRALIDSKNSENTKISWRQALEHFQSFAGGSLTFADLSRPQLEAFKSYLLTEKKLSPNSAQVYFARIKTALSQAVKDGILDSNPAEYISIRGEETSRTFLNIKEIRKLAKTPCGNPHVRNAFLFSCFSGLRSSDILALTWGRIKDGILEFTQVKTRSSERIFLSPEALHILKAQHTLPPSNRINRKQSPDAVFQLPRQSTIDKIIKRWAERAKIGKVISMHTARHSFAVLALASGIDIYTTSKLLGHKNLGTTQIYAKVIDEKKQQAVRSLPRL